VLFLCLSEGEVITISDGTIKISIEVDGKQINIAAKDLKELESAGRESGKGVRDTEQGLKGVGRESTKASTNIKKVATALGLVAIGAAAFKVLSAAMGDAISRFDTLNKFPKVLQSLGVSAEDSQKAMKKLSDGIDGLPTKLNDIASTAQRMYTSFGDMDKAADSALALNNALLGSGASAEQASRGTEQYLKALQTGKMDMDTWRSLSETMDVALVKVAGSFGFAGRSAKNDLYQALKDGTITLDQFNDKMIELGTGTGELAELARVNSLGLATSISNLKTAASKGIADILASLNKLSKDTTGKELAQHIDSLKVIVNTSFKVIGRVIEGAVPVVKGFANAVGATLSVVKTLSPAIIGLMTAYAAYTAISKAAAAIEASNKVLAIAQASHKALTIATRAQMAAQVGSTTATSADIVAKAAQAGTVKLATLAIGVMTGSISLSAAVQAVATAASYALGAAIQFMMGPIGWVTAGIGLLVTGVIAVVKWFKKSTEESKRLNAETEKLKTSTDALNDSIKSTSDAHTENQRSIKATAQANQDLAEKVEELAVKENKSAAEKQMLRDYINQLNESVSGLNLSYNEEANALSMSSEEMKARIGLMEEQASYNAALERQVEISKEQNEVEQQLAEINKLREEWNLKLEEGTVKAGEHKKAMGELNEQEKALTETNAQLAEQQKETEEQMTASMEAITEATEKGISAQMIAFEDLSESQQETVESMKSTWEDYKDAATDMFDTLSDKAELSVSEMTKNLEENQRIIGEWAEGIATLAERGVDEGLLETLRAAGPESAGHVNALVNASDAELAHLSEVFANGGDVATKALAKSLGIEESGVMEAVGHLVSGAEQSLKEEIESANFPTIGESIPKGTAEGIEKGTPEAEKASKGMADKTTKAAKDSFKTQSPSKVFREIGGDLTDGLALGIDQGSSRVVQAVQKMFQDVESNSRSSFSNITRQYDNAVSNLDKSLSRLPVVTQKAMSDTTSRLKSGSSNQVSAMQGLSRSYDREIRQVETSLNKLPKIAEKAMKNTLDKLKSGSKDQVDAMKKLSADLKAPFKSLNSEFNAMGQNAMQGLDAGLRARRGQVMATARSIANSVAAEMRKALKVSSPSRVMRDDIGKMIPAGLALGIGDNAKLVYEELSKLSSGMMKMATPEVALGASKMRYAGAGFGSQSISTITNNNKKLYSPTIQNYFTKDVSTPSEVARKNRQQQQRLAMEWGF
jgi:tape measure domain-containing protein